MKMRKMTLTIVMAASPSEAVAGLDLDTVHPPLARAKEEVVEAQQSLDNARGEHARLECAKASYPGRIQAGKATAAELRRTLIDLETSALRLPAMEADVVAARDRVAVEERNARAALEAEVRRRHVVVEKAAAGVDQVLTELHDTAIALSKVLASDAWGDGLRWTQSPAAEVDAANAAMVAGAMNEATADKVPQDYFGHGRRDSSPSVSPTAERFQVDASYRPAAPPARRGSWLSRRR